MTFITFLFIYFSLLLDTIAGGPFNVNLTMGELYLCACVWFDNFHEKPAFGCTTRTSAEGSVKVEFNDSENENDSDGDGENENESESVGGVGGERAGRGQKQGDTDKGDGPGSSRNKRNNGRGKDKDIGIGIGIGKWNSKCQVTLNSKEFCGFFTILGVMYEESFLLSNFQMIIKFQIYLILIYRSSTLPLSSSLFSYSFYLIYNLSIPSIYPTFFSKTSFLFLHRA